MKSANGTKPAAHVVPERTQGGARAVPHAEGEPAMNEHEALRADIEGLYLGNLGTIEFDIELPTKGEHGTRISWESDEPRFLDASGKVSRPSYGRGNREVTLTATFTNGEATATRTYTAQVLEEGNDIEIARACPIQVEAAVGTTCHLPDSVAVITTDGRCLAQRVVWDDGDERTWKASGSYAVTGCVRGTTFRVAGSVRVAAAPERTVSEQLRRRVTSEGLDVRLEGPSDFLDAQERMHEWLLSTDPDTWLYNFRVAAGLDTRGAAKMTGWDSPDGNLRGHSTGHYLSALARCYRATGDEHARERLSYLVRELDACREGLEARGCRPGFLSAYDESQFDKLERYVPYPKIWAPWYTFHKILAGLVDAHELAHVDGALELAHGMGLWAWRRLSRLPHDQLVAMWNIYIAGEYGGMNDALARLGELTGDGRMVQAARLFDNDRLFFPLEQGVDALNGMHANQHIPQVVGAMRLFGATGESRYLRIAERFWEEVTGSHRYAIGGTGESEMWHAPGAEAALLTASTCESCASYNMMKLTGLLQEHEPSAQTMAYYERVLFGHALGTSDKRVTGGTTYFISMRPGARKEFDYLENSCCHGTGMEEPFMYADHAYHLGRGEDGVDELYVELALSTRLRAEGVDVVQRVAADDPGRIDLDVSCRRALRLRVRIPSWCEGDPASCEDGLPFIAATEAGYLVTDLIPGTHALNLRFPCRPRVERAADDATRYVAFFGPHPLAVLSQSTEVLELPAAEVTDALEQDPAAPLTFRWRGRDLTLRAFEQLSSDDAYQLYLRDC